MSDEPTVAEVEKLIQEMALPTETPAMLAGQILKRARQLAERRGLSTRECLDHLLNLLKQGWAAKQKGATDVQ